jgi:ribosomal protein S18 acetylase RimI-like enzyme
MIGTPSKYSKTKMLGNPPETLPKGSYFLTLIENKEILGSLYVKLYQDQYVIRDVFIKENMRGKGLGRKIMNEILEFLKPKKKNIILYVDPQNKIARKLYLSLGFIFEKKSYHGDKLVINSRHE